MRRFTACKIRLPDATALRSRDERKMPSWRSQPAEYWSLSVRVCDSPAAAAMIRVLMESVLSAGEISASAISWLSDSVDAVQGAVKWAGE